MGQPLTTPPGPPDSPSGMVVGWCRTVVGLAVGAVTAVAGAGLLAAAGATLLAGRLWPPLTSYAWAGAGRLAELERRRVALFHRGPRAWDARPSYDGRRALGYLAARVPVGLLGGLVLFLLAWGAVTGVTFIGGWLAGERPDGIAPTAPIVAYLTVMGAVLLFLVLQGIAGVAALERRLVLRLLGPTPEELLRRRIDELSASRAGIVEAVDEERRRIERDLHDGIQQRLVALAVLLGRARRGRRPELLDELLRQAHEQSGEALRELRDVAWRVYPTALDTHGLEEALSGVAERSAVPVKMSLDLPVRLPPTVETAVYFVVCEAVTNAAKHAEARLITADLSVRDKVVTMRICDDGRGGADPSGTGLRGLARRVAALDGAFRIDSPPGGPTVIEVELPCG
ncbi:sensor histidine kinase [Microtetraspora niveoalba]|uniref:sensor histidine kinase n=1 Tax=Microtetraspora niveoalba TaxID=46175 RepID=UPI000A81FBE6|nr:histidine kinase [Microtetraspora niveoalba]